MKVSNYGSNHPYATVRGWVSGGAAVGTATLSSISLIVINAAITANTDNWNPTNLSTASVIRADPTADWNLTGITAPPDDRLLILENIDTAFSITLKHDITSTAANRFLCPDDTDLLLGPDTGVWLRYDLTSARWRVLGLAGGGGTGGRPPWDYVVAANDSSAAMQAIADAVCDGTNDQVEINAAITAAVTANRPYSILLLPGTYLCGAAVDFTGWTANGGDWCVFEASGTTIKAAANLTTLIKLDPGAGGQIITCADIRLGAVDGNVGTNTVTNLVALARFNDNILRIEDVRNGSGVGVAVLQAGVADYPNGNNKIDIEIIHNMGGSAFYVTGDTSSPYGFQGNTVHIGEIIACDNGIVLGTAVNQSAGSNLFICGVIEHNTGYGIRDYCGGNTFIVANLNSNGVELGGPTGMTFRSSYSVDIILAASGTIDAAVLDQHYVQINGVAYGRHLFAERASTPGTPASGYGDIYFKADGKLYSLNDAGTEVELGGSGGVTGFATPAVVLGTAAAAGAATTVIRSDGTIAAFDATVPTTIAAGDTAATGSVAFAARRDHRHGAPSSFGIGEILVSDTPSTPLVFADLIQNEAQDDLVYADI